jgi:hypothetical protein
MNRSLRRAAALAVALTLTVALRAGVAAAVPFDRADFSGFATGNVLHADALSSGDVKLVNVEEAWTGAAVASRGLTEIKNEMNRVVVPASAAKRSYGRGSGLEAGVAVAPPDANQIPLPPPATADAPPDSGPVVQEVLSLPAAPLAYAAVLRGVAGAAWSSSSTCVLGRDLSSGRGFAADVQLVDTGTPNEDGTLGAPLVAADASDPSRRVAESFSHTFLDVQRDASGKPLGLRFGLSSEVRMTIAPITIAGQVTLEFLGEWVLRATAGGVPGSAHVHYGPGEVSPETPILRILQNGNVTNILRFQDLLTDQGLVVNIPGVVELAIGEDPRAIGGDADSKPAVAADGTSASAAVDVVRIKAIGGQVADVRLGHMEVSAQVPAGGIDCGVPVTKSASPRGVTVGQSFIVSIKIDNPFGCDMTSVRVVDEIRTRGDARFQVVATNPPANQVPSGSNLASGTIVWNDIGPIPKGSSKTVTTTIRAQGGGGIIEDIATATATLGRCEGQGEGSQLVGRSLPLQVPVVLQRRLPPTGVGTAGPAAAAALALLGLAALGVRVLRRT